MNISTLPRTSVRHKPQPKPPPSYPDALSGQLEELENIRRELNRVGVSPKLKPVIAELGCIIHSAQKTGSINAEGLNNVVTTMKREVGP